MRKKKERMSEGDDQIRNSELRFSHSLLRYK